MCTYLQRWRSVPTRSPNTTLSRYSRILTVLWVRWKIEREALTAIMRSNIKQFSQLGSETKGQTNEWMKSLLQPIICCRWAIDKIAQKRTKHFAINTRYWGNELRKIGKISASVREIHRNAMQRICWIFACFASNISLPYIHFVYVCECECVRVYMGMPKVALIASESSSKCKEQFEP